ncbi:TetR/AcrR family transcriptional regulator [Angustibacter sp. McL0619]|uniref:TetR/AcrR family transcriptional regulator n=1 Tax=Angustibacter sp. McL0619 TaxID=3415676 RepID=UPI003CEB4FA8
MSRPREHDEKLAEALLDAAEQRIAVDGLDALALRLVAADAGTTTRAVYTLFGAKDGLVGALGMRAMRLLASQVDALPATSDPVADVVEAALVFRRFALEHPALFSVAFHRASAAGWPLFRDAAVDAFATLQRRFEPLADSGLLGDRTVFEAAQQFDALCEGIAWVELRGNLLTPDPQAFWRSAVAALVEGFAATTARGETSVPTARPVADR